MHFFPLYLDLFLSSWQADFSALQQVRNGFCAAHDESDTFYTHRQRHFDKEKVNDTGHVLYSCKLFYLRSSPRASNFFPAGTFSRRGEPCEK